MGDIVEGTELISREMLKGCIVGGTTNVDKLYEAINGINWSGGEDKEEVYRDNIIGYMAVLTDPDSKVRVGDYLNAVKYVTNKLAGLSNKDAYKLAFPERVERIIKGGGTEKDISAFVSMYTKSKLVVKMLQQSLVPTYLVNADLWQEALNVEATLMREARSEKVRSDAAAKILDVLKPPEAAKLEIDIGIKQDSSVSELREAARELAKAQRLALENGEVGARDLAEAKLISGSVVDE